MMREIILKKLANWHTAHPWRMLILVLLVTIVLAGFAGKITVTTRTSDLMPEDDPKVKVFNQILDEFLTATNLVIVVQGEEERIKEYADRIAPLLLELKDSTHNEEYQNEVKKMKQKIDQLKSAGDKHSEIVNLEKKIKNFEGKIDLKLFQRIDYKTPVEFLKSHALMLAKADDLKNMKDMFTDPNLVGLITNLNNSLEKEYVGKEESISTREEEEGAFGFLDGIENLIYTLQRVVQGEVLSEEEIRLAVDKLLIGEPYFLSNDKTALILNAIPNFSLMDRGLLMIAANTGHALVSDLKKEFPDLTVGLTGQIARERDEQVYSEQSIGITSVIALVAILIFLMVSFRMWVAPLLAVMNLIIGLIWAMGIAFLVVEQLNMMTAMLSVLFLGLGIDFSIHLISTFTEGRALGDTIPQAMERAFLKSGKGIVTGALTTACAFLTLIISQARGMREMGIVAGTGLLAILLTTLLALPIMLYFRERRIEKRREKKSSGKFIQRDISFGFLGNMGTWLSKHHVFTIIASIIITIFLGWQAFNITWDYDYRNMEPKGLESIELMDTIMDKFDLSMEYALVLTDSIAESNELAEKYRELSTVAIAEDISLFLPTEDQQKKRIPHIQEIQEKIQSIEIKESISTAELAKFNQEIDRLQMNIMEMQDMAFLGGKDKVDNKCKQIVGDPENPESKNIIRDLLQLMNKEDSSAETGLSRLQQVFGPYFQESIIRMGSTDSIRMDDLPASILDRYANKSRDMFLVTIYPSGSLYDGEYANQFSEDLNRVSEKTTGLGPLMIALLDVFGRDGRNAVLLTLGIVFLLLWVDFKKIRYALMAMIPLAFGIFWMVGLMNLAGILLSMSTVMGLPLIVGIGIDDGVHIMHRWRIEGNDRIHTVFSSTGKAILLTSLTTMLAFGSLVFSAFPAWGLFGGALFLGVATCFLTTTIILPGIFGMIKNNNRK
jgi:predicted RND superfamily exporter protein